MAEINVFVFFPPPGNMQNKKWNGKKEGKEEFASIKPDGGIFSPLLSLSTTTLLRSDFTLLTSRIFLGLFFPFFSLA